MYLTFVTPTAFRQSIFTGSSSSACSSSFSNTKKDGPFQTRPSIRTKPPPPPPIIIPSTTTTITTPRATATAPTPHFESNGRAIDYELAPGEIAVRFINTPSGQDVIAAANPGDGLLNVGDSVGIRIPRACQTGLCGSCTCDVIDTTAENGRQTIRACQASAVIPDGGKELIVDVERMKNAPLRNKKDPMARFENMDTDYVAGALPNKTGNKRKFSFPRSCTDCNGTGEIVCYHCDGTGREDGEPMGSDRNENAGNSQFNMSRGRAVCNLCVGMTTLRCATCQGKGEIGGSR